ncbi:MAG: beta-galactosidase/beta-glucuronidase [Actinomycetia bacterium]|nr:beta-galactosidase/beta-glucuronidase [Actinomycetes bacterium]
MSVLERSEWQLRGCLGREWEWHTGPDKAWDAPGWLPARVPGSVLDDLMRAGEVADLYHQRNSRLAEWVPERAWVYRTRFAVPAETPLLRFGGVDFACTVLVDGRELARHEGMFRPFEVDVSEYADGAEHLLAVVVHPAPASESQVGDTSRVRVHKPRMGYGWDFCPRLVHQGIWRPVRLVSRDARDVQPQVTLEDGIGVVRAGGELELLDGDRVVATGAGELRVESPELWWPNGLGRQHLYTLRAAGKELRIGFRTAELIQNDGAAEGSLPYTLVVNGERAYITGWNWTPIDPLYGVPRPEKLAHLLELTARANVNLLRVWGGGLIETDEFYEHCDRLGLLVWQEFSLSSSGMNSVPADDDAFVRTMIDEARAIVPAKRHHPSLAVWCGGNELARSDPARDDVPLDDAHPVLGALRSVVRELDPDRAWLPTSPSGPRFLNRLDVIAEDPRGQHDVHGPWEHQGLRRHYELYDAGTAQLHSEFGVEGMTNRRALEALIEPEHRWPADRSNPIYEHLGAWWNNAPLVQECFGGRIADLDTLRRASQQLQYDGLRYAVEAGRRRAFRSSGTIPWQFNESYPNAWCTAAVDHRGDPKPAYWGVKRAYRGSHACAAFATCAWGGEHDVRARVHAWGDAPPTARIVDLYGTALASGDGEVSVELDLIGTDVFFLDLDVNRYVMTRTSDLAPLLDLPAATVDAELSGSTLTLRNTGAVAAIGLVLEDARPVDTPGWLTLSDNVIDLLPGESRELTVGWRDGERGPVLVEGWNVEDRHVA